MGFLSTIIMNKKRIKLLLVIAIFLWCGLGLFRYYLFVENKSENVRFKSCIESSLDVRACLFVIDAKTQKECYDKTKDFESCEKVFKPDKSGMVYKDFWRFI